METTDKNIKGEWVINSDGYYPYCSICLEEPKSGMMTDECPNCGAKMNVKEKFKNINVYGLKLFTNADYLHSLSNKELSRFLISDWMINDICKNCEGEYKECGNFKYCESKIFEWLSKEKQ